MSKRQFVFITACFVQGSFMYTMYYYQVVKKESWITLVAGMLLGLLIAFIYGSLYKMHFDEGTNTAKGLVEINMDVYGKSAGRKTYALGRCRGQSRERICSGKKDFYRRPHLSCE